MSSAPETGGEPHRSAQAGDYAALRERLAALGYLSRPLDRFVLSGVLRPGSFLRSHAAVSARVALAAGPLLGLLFALAVVVVNRPRFARPLDFLVLAGYFSILFGGLVLVLELASGFLLAALVRARGRGVRALHATASRAGLVVSLLVSAYLAFWWKRRAGVTGGLALDIGGLIVLLVVNAALLRVSSLASLAALVRASDLPPSSEAARGVRSRLLAGAAAALLAVGFLVAPRAAQVAVAAPFERVDVPGRLVVIAWDGIPTDHFGRLFAPGDAAMHTRGGRRFVLAPLTAISGEGAPSRPSFWTMVATGLPPSEHGVTDAEEKRELGLSAPLGGRVPMGAVLRSLVPGRRVAVSAQVRRGPTAWEILAEREGVGVVGWWATWPATAEGASTPFAIVSDRALFALDPLPEESMRVAPPSLARALGASLSQDLTSIRAEARTAIGGDFSSHGIEQAALIDGWAARCATRIAEDPKIKSLFVYFPGLDILQNSDEPEADEARTPRAERFAAYGAHLLDRLLTSCTADDWIVVIADPGRVRRGGTGGEEAARSWIALSGPGVLAADSSRLTAEDPWDPLDVAPTLLNLRGFPASGDMKGKTRTTFLHPTWRDRLRPRRIESYGERRSVPSLPDASEEEALERLRSLGYVN